MQFPVFRGASQCRGPLKLVSMNPPSNSSQGFSNIHGQRNSSGEKLLQKVGSWALLLEILFLSVWFVAWESAFHNRLYTLPPACF